MGMLERLNCSS